jgi:F-type H+-transporting ATPase subunit b
MTRHPRAAAVLGAVLCAAGPARAAEGGLQLVPEPERLIALLLLFLVLVPVLNALLFKPLLGVLEERGRRIEGARARAAELSTRSAALVAQHEEAVQAVRQAAHHERAKFVDEARRAHQAAIAGARADAERQLAATRSEIGAAIDTARNELRAAAEPLARQAAERLLGRSLS